MRLTEDIRREKFRKKIPLFLAGGFVLFITILLYPKPAPKQIPPAKKIKPGEYARIVSLAPSITEILYALNSGNKIVGVTQFCRFPPEAALKPKVGGLLDTNFESVFKLNPDLIILLSTDVTQKPQFDKMSLPTLEVGANSIEEVIEAIRLIGKTLMKNDEAQALIDSINKRVEWVKVKTKNMSRPTVMIVFWRAVGEGNVKEAYIAGSDKFHNQLIELAGGRNVYEGREVISPLVSAEGIMKLDPDFILEVMSLDEMSGFTNDEIIKDWAALPELKAFKNKHIYVLNKSYMGIPGPRFPSALEAIVRTIHPEIKWE